ncbi:FumA C-terminus/TtdB family hydratase beta subunit [Methanonatronarchaeum sp. AMET-Sl]|uniref:FumA C-terminus/TtdB family hydratase beta subunit n=1 Tax=Methanonatronarchaeum sp. AMET-Sl TaxID=3037654 RepID=UPI00244E3DB3|nr:FumA C-terminus/TtdB family hydratase beta subunit [Methanonatronarchaeum sp. AMET-Sl]WGI17630.1 FumA C-terminus/TtdB family hydratase beta subunit [Methanonatronarchaeum sp. AMET-Sl]
MTKTNTNIITPISKNEIMKLRAGDEVQLSGVIYTARDSAHKRILENDIELDLDGAVIYHCGPLMEKNDWWRVVAAGPTTSTRLSKFIPKLLQKHKIRAMIGKGGLGKQAIRAMEKYGCCYLAYTGGCAALASDQITEVMDVKWLDLGMPEAIWKLKIKNLPTTVAIDTQGNNLYKK